MCSSLACLVVAASVLLLLPAAVHSEEPYASPAWRMSFETAHPDADDPGTVHESGATWALDDHRFELDGRTNIRGWRLSEHWYFGYQRGNQRGLSLVWQQERTRVSLTPEGMRVSRLLF